MGCQLALSAPDSWPPSLNRAQRVTYVPLPESCFHMACRYPTPPLNVLPPVNTSFKLLNHHRLIASHSSPLGSSHRPPPPSLSFHCFNWRAQAISSNHGSYRRPDQAPRQRDRCPGRARQEARAVGRTLDGILHRPGAAHDPHRPPGRR